MTRLALCLLLLATGASATENVIDVQHDSQRGVTCYLLNGVGISCIPDSQITSPTSTTSNETQGARASTLTSMWKNEQLPTTPTPTQAPAHWNEERYSL
uniref:hypothetical protein n=1 Tax=Pseudomonas laurentiana TaxID=2364649 RepID=UPI0029C9A14C|nr:hypothetical protein [Pseudomonas laurentiana]